MNNPSSKWFDFRDRYDTLLPRPDTPGDKVVTKYVLSCQLAKVNRIEANFLLIQNLVDTVNSLTKQISNEQ